MVLKIVSMAVMLLLAAQVNSKHHHGGNDGHNALAELGEDGDAQIETVKKTAYISKEQMQANLLGGVENVEKSATAT
jgi:hypothetical protein